MRSWPRRSWRGQQGQGRSRWHVPGKLPLMSAEVLSQLPCACGEQEMNYDNHAHLENEQCACGSRNNHVPAPRVPAPRHARWGAEMTTCPKFAPSSPALGLIKSLHMNLNMQILDNQTEIDYYDTDTPSMAYCAEPTSNITRSPILQSGLKPCFCELPVPRQIHISKKWPDSILGKGSWQHGIQ